MIGTINSSEINPLRMVADEAMISPMSLHDPCSLNNLQEEKSNLAVGTGVVSTKYPLTVKLELFSTLEC